jgi:pimeloyl-ACP methyl ester carboxylesterase/glycine cleavage system regulatory protein
MKVCAPLWPSSRGTPDDGLTWYRATVGGRPASYGVGGTNGPAVVFLHGWATGSRSYQQALRRLVDMGCRVYAPALPSFGGTADLAAVDMNLGGYAEWVADFMAEAGIDEPVVVIGHSFGGGVGTKLAQAKPHLVRYLILLNAVGGVTPRSPYAWVAAFGRELWPLPQAWETVQALQGDVIRNVTRNPAGLLRAALLARDADLRAELADLRNLGVPVLVLHSEGDEIIPRRAFYALCESLGTDGRMVSGRHAWLLADPDSFGEVLATVVDVEVARHRQWRATGRAGEITELLAGTKVPARTVQTLLRSAPPLWLLSESAATLSTDIALCHPRLRKGEIRAVAHPIEKSRSVRLTVVATDRRALLADSASVLASSGLSIVHATAATWPERRLAVHSFVLSSPAGFDQAVWSELQARLRTMAESGGAPAATIRPARAQVTVQGAEADRSMVRVLAGDQIGLLSAVCRWFAERDVSIDSLHAQTVKGRADDTFLVAGQVDARALTGFLEGTPR